MESQEPKKVSIFMSPEESAASEGVNAVREATNDGSKRALTFDKYLESLPEEKREEAIARYYAPPTVQEVDRLIASGVRYQFTDPEFAYEYYQFKATQKGNLLKDIADAAGMVPEIIGAAGKRFIDDPLESTAKLVPSAIEGLVQNARDTYGIVMASNDPSSPFFRMKAYFSGQMTKEEMMSELNKNILFQADSMELAEGKQTIVFDERFIDKDITLAAATFLEPELLFPALGPVALPAAIARAAGFGAQVEKAALRVQKIKSALIGGTLKWGVGKPAQFVGNLAAGTIESVAEKGANILENFTGIDPNDLNRAGRAAGLATASAHVAGFSVPYAGPIAATHLGGGLLAGFGQAVTETSEQILRSQGHRGVIGFARQALKDAPKNGIKLTKQGEVFLKLIDTFDPAFSYAYHTAEGALTGGFVGGLISYGSQGSDAIGQGIGYGLGAGAVGGAAGRLVTSGVGSLRRLRREVQAEFAIRSINEYNPETAKNLDALRNHPAADADYRQSVNELIVSLSELEHNALVQVFGGSTKSEIEFALWRQTNKGVLEITNAQFANVEAFSIIRKQDGQLVIGVNADKLFSSNNQYGKMTLPHELLHAITMTTAIGPHFVSIAKDLIFGVRDANGKVLQRPLVNSAEIDEFMSQYREAETGWWKSYPAGPERDAAKRQYIMEKALQSSALAKLNNDPQVGGNTTLTKAEEAALGKYASEFLAYYFSAMFKEIPMEFFLKGGKLDGIQNVLQIAKDAMRDHWEDRISFHEPRFNFFRERENAIDAGFFRNGKRVRIGAIDYLIRDMLRANMEYKNRGVIDFSKMSEYTKDRLIESGAGSVLIRDPKTGKVRSKTKKEIRDDNKRRGAAGYRVLNAMDPALRRSVTGPDGVIRGDYSDAEFDALVQNGVISAAEGHMGKLFQRTKDSNGQLPNVFEFGVLAASKQIEGLGDNDRVTGDRVPLTNRKVLLADVIMEYGADGHFSMRIKALDMKVIDRRKANLWYNPAVRSLWGDSRELFEADFKAYLANASLPHNHPARVETSRLLDKGDGRGDARRDIMHQAAGFAKGEDRPYINTPIAQIPRGTLMSVTDFSIPTMLNLRTTGESYNYLHANAFYDIAANFKPAAFKPVSGYKDMYNNELGYKVVKEGNKFVAYSASNAYIGAEDTFEKVGKAIERHFEGVFVESRNKANLAHASEVKSFKPANKRQIQEAVSGKRSLKDISEVSALTEEGRYTLVEQMHGEYLAERYRVLSADDENSVIAAKEAIEGLLTMRINENDKSEKPLLVEVDGEIRIRNSKEVLIKRGALDNPNELRGILKKAMSYSGIKPDPVSAGFAQAMLSYATLNWVKKLNGKNNEGSVIYALHTTRDNSVVKSMDFDPNKETTTGGTSFATGNGHIKVINRKPIKDGTPYKGSLLFRDENGQPYGQFVLSALRVQRPLVIDFRNEMTRVQNEIFAQGEEAGIRALSRFSNGKPIRISKSKDGKRVLAMADKDSREALRLLTDAMLIENNKDRVIVKVSRMMTNPDNIDGKYWSYGSAVSLLIPTAKSSDLTAVLGANYEVVGADGVSERVPTQDASIQSILRARDYNGPSLADPEVVELNNRGFFSLASRSEMVTDSAGIGELSNTRYFKPANAAQHFERSVLAKSLSIDSEVADFRAKLFAGIGNTAAHPEIYNLVTTPSYERLKDYAKVIEQQLNDLDSDPIFSPISQEEFKRTTAQRRSALLAEYREIFRQFTTASSLASGLGNVADSMVDIFGDNSGYFGNLIHDTSMRSLGTYSKLQGFDDALYDILYKLESRHDEYLSTLSDLDTAKNNLNNFKSSYATEISRRDSDTLRRLEEMEQRVERLTFRFENRKIVYEAVVDSLKEIIQAETVNPSKLKSLVKDMSDGYFTVAMINRVNTKMYRHSNEARGGNWDSLPQSEIDRVKTQTVDYFNLHRQPQAIRDMLDKVAFGAVPRATVVPTAKLRRLIETVRANTSQDVTPNVNGKITEWNIRNERQDSALFRMLRDSNSELHKELLYWQNELADKVKKNSSYRGVILGADRLEKTFDNKRSEVNDFQDYEAYKRHLEQKKEDAKFKMYIQMWFDHAEASKTADGGLGWGDNYYNAAMLFTKSRFGFDKENFQAIDRYLTYLEAHKKYTEEAKNGDLDGAAARFHTFLNEGFLKDDVLLHWLIQARKDAYEEFSELNTKTMFVSGLKNEIINLYDKFPAGIKPKEIIKAIEKINSSGVPVKTEASAIGLLDFIKSIETARKGKPDEKVQLSEILDYLDKNSFKVVVRDKIGIIDLDRGYSGGTPSTQTYTLGHGIGSILEYGTIGAWIDPTANRKYFPHVKAAGGHLVPRENSIVHVRYTIRTLGNGEPVLIKEEVQSNAIHKNQIEALELLKKFESYKAQSRKINLDMIRLIKEDLESAVPSADVGIISKALESLLFNATNSSGVNMPLGEHAGNKIAEIGYSKLRKSKKPEDRYAAKILEAVIRGKQNGLRHSLDLSQRSIDLVPEIFSYGIRGQRDGVRLPSSVLASPDALSGLRKRYDYILGDEDLLRDIIGSDYVSIRTADGVSDASRPEMSDYVNDIAMEILTPDVIRSIHSTVLDGIRKYIAVNHTNGQEMIGFSSVITNLRDSTLGDKIQEKIKEILKNKVKRSKFADGSGFAHYSKTPVMMTEGAIADSAAKLLAEMSKGKWVDSSDNNGFKRLLTKYSDALTMRTVQVRDLKVQDEYYNGILSGKISDPEARNEVSVYGGNVRIDMYVGDRLQHGHVYGSFTPYNSANEMSKSFVRLLKLYSNIKTLSVDEIANALDSAQFSLLRNTTNNGFSTVNVGEIDPARNIPVVYGGVTASVLDTNPTQVTAAMLYAGQRHGDAQTSLAIALRNAIKTVRSGDTSQARWVVGEVLRAYYGDNYADLANIGARYEAGVASGGSTDIAQTGDKALRILRRPDLFDKSHLASLDNASRGDLAEVYRKAVEVINATRGSDSLSDSDLSAFSDLVADKLYPEFRARLIEAAKERQYLTFQSASEHRLVGLRMALKKAALSGVKRVVLGNADLVGSVSGFPTFKARALYTKTDPNLAEKEARRLGLKVVKPYEVDTYSDELLDSMGTPEYATLIKTLRAASTDAMKKRIELTKALFPKFVIENGTAVPDKASISKDVLDFLPFVSNYRAAGWESLGIFNYPDASSNNTFKYSDTGSREYTFSMMGNEPNLAVQKIVFDYELERFSRDTALESLYKHVTTNNGVGDMERPAAFNHAKGVKGVLSVLHGYLKGKNIDLLGDYERIMERSEGLFSMNDDRRKLIAVSDKYKAVAALFESQKDNLPDGGKKIAELGSAWAMDAALTIENAVAVLSPPNDKFGPIDRASATTTAVILPDNMADAPKFQKEFEEGMPFYKPTNKNMNPNSPSFRNDFFTSPSAYGGLKKKVKMYVEPTEDAEKYQYLVRVQKLDGSSIDEANRETEVSIVISKADGEATLVPQSTDFESEYMQLAKEEAMARIGAFGAKSFSDLTPTKKPDEAPEVGEPVVINKGNPMLEDRSPVAMKPNRTAPASAPQQTWTKRASGYGTTLTSMDGYYIMAMNNKFRLYNANQAMIGIYATEDEAKRRARAYRERNRKP